MATTVDYSNPSSFLQAGSNALGTYTNPSIPGGSFDIVNGNLVFVPGTSTPAPTATTPAPKPASNFPDSVPTANVANPVVTPVTADTPGAQAAASGFDLFQAMLDNVLKAEQLRQSAIDQQVNIAQLFADMQRASPTQAADLAVKLGIPGLEPDLSFANAFTNAGTTGTFGGRVGTQDIQLPFAFSGKELTFLGNNPNVSSIISDIGSRFGRPDVLKNSMAALLPTNTSLAGTF